MEKLNAKCRKVREADLERIMHWRMLPEITKYMNTNPVLTMEDQRRWFAKIRDEEKMSLEEGRKEFYWILEVDDVPAGVVSLVNADKVSKKIDTGVYIAEKEKRSLRLILDVQWNLYRYSFEVLHMNKVCEEVFLENKGVNRLLDICGSKREGILRQHIRKDETYYDVVLRGILKKEWEEKKKTLEYNFIAFEE